MRKFFRWTAKMTALLLSVVMAISAQTAFADCDSVPNTSYPEYQCDHIEYLDDGGRIYVYYIDGIKNSFPVPPDGFDPLTASDDDLSTYGFPPKPSDQSELNEWTELMETYSGTPIPRIVRTDVCFNHSRTAVDSADQESQGENNRLSTSYSTNWSGYISNLTGINNKYTQAQVDYKHPTISSTYGTSSLNVAGYWVGIGGENSVSLVQAGTADTGANNSWAWYEYLGPNHMNPAVQLSSLTINPGDNIHVYIAFSTSAQKFNYYISNSTTGQHASGIVSNLDPSIYYDGSSAEWITEKASSYLPNFGSITMKNCKAMLYTSSTWSNLNSLSGLTKCIMTSNGLSSGTLRCSPGSVYSSTYFTNTWYNYY